MLMRSGISIFLGKSKVNNVYQVPLLPQSHQKIIWLHISMDEVFGVNVLYSADLQKYSTIYMYLFVTKTKYKVSKLVHVHCKLYMPHIKMHWLKNHVSQLHYCLSQVLRELCTATLNLCILSVVCDSLIPICTNINLSFCTKQHFLVSPRHARYWR